MRIKLSDLKGIIHNVITEAEIADTIVSKNVEKKLDSNTALTQAVQKVGNSKDLAALINNIIGIATSSNSKITRSDVLKALSGVTTTTKSADKKPKESAN
jgi:hypothetical protein